MSDAMLPPHAAESAEEVRVVGQRESLVDESPSMTRVDRDRLAAPGMRLGEALRVVPGVAVRDAGGYGAFSSAALRGGTAAQTPVYFGSVLVNDDVAGTADLSAFAPSLLERIEVHRGHAPLELDRQGLGGAIVLVPRVARDLHADAAITAGTFGHRTLRGTASHAGDAYDVVGAVVHERADNDYPYVDDRGTLFDASDDRTVNRGNADISMTSGLVSGSMRFGDTGLRAFAFGSTREQGVPRLAVLPSVAARLDQHRELVAVEGDTRLGEHTTLKVRTTGTWAGSTYTDPLAELGLGTARLTIRGTRFDERVALDIKSASIRVFAAVGALEEGLAREGTSSLEASRFSARSQLGTSVALGAGLALEAAVVHEEQWQRAQGAATDVNARAHEQVSTGRLVAKWSGERVETMVVGSRYARTPTLGERFGVDGSIRGNAALEPEFGYAADAIVRGAVDDERRVRFEAVTFIRWMTNLVDYTKTSPGTVKPINIGSARLVGAEAVIDIRLPGDASLGAVTTLLDAEDTTDGNALVNRRLPFRARHVESCFIRYFPTFAEGRSLHVEWRTNVEGERTVDPAGLARIPAQAWSDATLRGRRAPFEVAMRWGNVFNAARIDLVGYPLPGRTIDMTLAVDLP